MQLVANLSLLFTELPLLARLQAAKAAGFDAVEIQFPYEIPALQLKQELQRCDLTLALINLPAGDLMQGGLGLACRVEQQAAFRQALDQAVSYALVVQPKMVNVLAGRMVSEEERAIATQHLVTNLQRAINAFQPLQIKVVCEAINPLDMPNFLINTPEQLLAVMQAVESEYCLAQLDIYHMARQGLDLVQSIEKLAAYLGHVQFADCPGRGEPGSGQLDFTQVLTTLKSVGYQGYLSAEYIPQHATTDSLLWKSVFEKQLKG